MGSLYDAAAVEKLCTAILEGLDTPPPTAAYVVGTLVDAALRGIDSHGILRMPRCELPRPPAARRRARRCRRMQPARAQRQQQRRQQHRQRQSQHRQQPQQPQRRRRQRQQ